MSARNQLRALIAVATGKSLTLTRCDAILADLTAAGYRVLGPGELDGETVEACIREIDCGCEKDHCPSLGFCVKDDVAALRSMKGQAHGTD